MSFLPFNKNLSQRARELRKTMTFTERKIWQHLRKSNYNVLRQKPIWNFIVDFYIPSYKLIIEIDGESHFTEDWIVYDRERSEYLVGLWLQVLRFTNKEIVENIKGVYETIMNRLK
jgi:very-short-patch-repair endonuclease